MAADDPRPLAPMMPLQIAGGTKAKPFYSRTTVDKLPVVQVRELPPVARRATHSVTSPNQEQSQVAYLYDYYDYPTAGQNIFNFFGRSQNAAGLNNTDTNMQQPGNTGAGVRFLVEHLWVDFLPGALPITSGAEATLATTNQLVDYWKVMAGKGFVQLFVNQTPQMGYGISPLKFAAAPVMVEAYGGVGAGVSALQALTPITVNGGYNQVMRPFWLDESMSFSVQIVFPALVTVSTLSRIGIMMKGQQVRKAS